MISLAPYEQERRRQEGIRQQLMDRRDYRDALIVRLNGSHSNARRVQIETKIQTAETQIKRLREAFKRDK